MKTQTMAGFCFIYCPYGTVPKDKFGALITQDLDTPTHRAGGDLLEILTPVVIVEEDDAGYAQYAIGRTV